MSVVDESISSASRADEVPVFKEPSGLTETEHERLRWVPRGTIQIVRGIKTEGGFYMYRPKNKSLSFAVDETLAVGRAENARSILDELMQFPRRLPGFAFHVAAIHTGLANHDDAFQWLHAASAERYVTMICLRFDPLFEPRRGDPRFRQLLIEIGL